MIIDELHTHVRQQLDNFGVRAESRILCAVSGGVDSVVLLDILHLLSCELLFTLGVIHADHGLRGEQSRQDAEFVKQMAEKRELPVFTESLPVREYARQHRCSIETAARTLRYDFFIRSARQFGATHVALAHTDDDNAETILLHLLRGAGLEGLAGIPPQRELFPGCWLIRPLLLLRKQQLYSYAQLRRLQWRQDWSNLDRRFRRNRIRWELLPLAEAITPNAVQRIARTGSILRQAVEGISQLMEPYLLRAALPTSGFFFSDADWDSLPPFFRTELIRIAIRRLGAPYSPPSHRLLQALALRTAQTGKRFALGRTLFLIRERNGLSLVPLLPPLPSLPVQPSGHYRLGIWKLEFQPVTEPPPTFPPDPWTEFMDADRLPDTLCWRPPRAGDRFHPLGLPREMKLGDFLTNQRIPHWQRRLLTVLADGNRILWLCGVRLSETVKVTAQSRHIVCARLDLVPQTEHPAYAPETD